MSKRSKTLMTLKSSKRSMIPKTLKNLSESKRTVRYNRRKSSMGLPNSIKLRMMK